MIRIAKTGMFWGPTIEAVERKQIRTTMREIHTTNYDTPIYCMICGTQTTDAKGFSG